jgi:large subunit ribosomal protein L1
MEDKIEKALSELRKNKERKFNQTIDLILNLRKIDPRKTSLNMLITLPHKVKDKKIAGFSETESSKIDIINPLDFKKYSNKTELRKLVKKYDFFISQAKLMPKVATTFGRALGPSGKMPSPQLGILANMNDKEIEELKNKINSIVKIRLKEPSIKIPIAKQDMGDKEIIENISHAYSAIIKELPSQKDNVKNVEIKLTMSKPIKIEL